MQPAPSKRESDPELVPLNPIRVETALSRYPVHRLARKGTIAIELREENERGATTLRWEVSHNSKYGQPGPLAFKVDTLVINRRIEEATRPIPRIIKLGSLNDLCRELGMRESGGNTNQLKKALYQNAFAGITAKVRYKMADGTQRTIEFGDTRYGVVFTGERLPDGRTADAVYIILHDFYREILDNAQTRPLDYDYLKELSPGSQRFYELLSYQIFAALKNNRPRAKLTYSEFCMYAPLTRHFDWERVRPQMAKIHNPHKKSGYVSTIEFEATTDKENRPDWLMLYTPGPRARSEFRAFTRRGGPKLILMEPDPPAAPEPTELERELISRGVTEATARVLLGEFDEKRIRAQIEHFDWVKAKHPRKVAQSPGGFLTEAIRKGYAAPAGFVSRAEQQRREEAEQEKRRTEAEEKRQEAEEKAQERAIQKQVDDYWQSLTEIERTRLDGEALKNADPETQQSYANQHPQLKGFFLRMIRASHIRTLLQTPPAL